MQSLRFLYRPIAAIVAGFATFTAYPSQAVVSPPPGYIYSSLLLATTTQNCVAAGPGGTFVGIGPGFKANAQAIVLAAESGTTRLVAFGFNSIGDCAYDRSNDVLYVTDNADNADLDITTGIFGNTGAQSGDTVFKIPSASQATGLTAPGLELVPPNSIPFASGVALAANGDVLVSDAAGTGTGSVFRIHPSGTPMTTFASGFDFTGGLAVHPTTGHVFVAESLSTFANQVSQFTPAGAVVASPLIGPSYAFGSIDLAFNADGRLLSTGVFFGDVVAIDISAPSATPFISGLTFAGGITVDPFTRRLEVLSSTFTNAPEDRSIHRFTPIDRLVAGGGSQRSDCLQQFYGIELVAPAPGRPERQALCVDGDPCDADGKVNDRCLFPLGFCLNVDDPSLPACNSANPIVSFEARATPYSAAIDAAVQAVVLPIPGSSCIFTDGVVVPVHVRSGDKRSGKAKVSATATSSDGRSDRDRATLVCVPA